MCFYDDDDDDDDAYQSPSDANIKKSSPGSRLMADISGFGITKSAENI